ncbi:Ankyrin repeat-containing domain protein [Rutstroemia sp. NJR-2017a WRK4]|nr:Ankyrin repeat-containing domain protein [Rutstroemia sp. NJR-2017a WRK4]
MAGVDAIASTMGIASFGITLLDGIKKAKEFWDAMKEAPDDMKYALKELDTLKLVLEDIRIHDTDPAPIAPMAASKCLTLCREGVEMLEKLVQDLNSVVDKRRRFGSAKVVLKKETIKKLQDRLNSAQRMLLLCRQTFAEAQLASYHAVQIDTFQASTHEMKLLLQREIQRGFQEVKAVVTQSSNQVAALHALPVIDAARTSFQATDYYERAIIGRSRRFRRKTEKPYFQSKIRMPLWFSRTSRTWDYAVHEIPAGWRHVFRQYYTVNYDAPVFRCIVRGDVEGVRELLATKRSTPFDRNVFGITFMPQFICKNQSVASYLNKARISMILIKGM